MSIILSAMTLHNILCACVGAVIYAVLSGAIRRLARQIRHQRRKWYKASAEYRNLQELLRQQGRDKLSAIMAETNDPWSAPEVRR